MSPSRRPAPIWGAQAALRALGLEEGGWQREAGAIEAASLDMIICPTLTADTHFPSEAARIRERIGATNAVCYDMSCACSGCVYGLSTADLIMAGAAFARQEAARTGRLCAATTCAAYSWWPPSA